MIEPHRVAALAVLVMILAGCSGIPQRPESSPVEKEIDDALKTLEVDRATTAIRKGSSEAGIAVKNDLIRRYFDDPLSLIAESDRLAGRMLDGQTTLIDRLKEAVAWTPEKPLEILVCGKTDRLSEMFREMSTENAESLDRALRQVEALSVDLRDRMTRLLWGADLASQWRREALARLTEEEIKFLQISLPALVADRASVSEDPEGRRRRTMELMAKVDYGLLFMSACMIAAVVEAARPMLTAAAEGEGLLLSCRTKIGLVRIGGKGADRYTEPAALHIDLGGDDVYAYDAKEGPGISVTVDLGGNDRYESSGRFAWGAAMLGCNIHVDCAGDDTYVGKGYTQGVGVGGVGVLLDEAGNDTYTAAFAGQGMGMWGVGMLIDRAGDDRYVAVDMSQGYGTVRGVGLLVDVSGNDQYRAGNFSHGVGAGRRHLTKNEKGDFIYGATSCFGGFGIVVDGAGNDTRIMGDEQGGTAQSLASSYFFGIGIVEDRAGNDLYEARKTLFCVGGAAHFGLSLLADGGGDDRYRTGDMATAYDNSCSLVLERGGNDHYDRIGRLIAANERSSRAIFVDLGGDDRYETKIFALSEGENALVVFVDAAGNDTYGVDPKEDWGNGREKIRKSAPVDGKRPGGLLRRDR